MEEGAKEIRTADGHLSSIGVALTRSNILVEWIELDEASNKLHLDEHTKAMKEAALNTICKILAVGPEVKNITPGQFALMGGAGRLITLNGVTYGIVKEHMIDAVFNERPKVGKDVGESVGGIKTELTQKELNLFSKKHSYPRGEA